MEAGGFCPSLSRCTIRTSNRSVSYAGSGTFWWPMSIRMVTSLQIERRFRLFVFLALLFGLFRLLEHFYLRRLRRCDDCVRRDEEAAVAARARPFHDRLLDRL